VGSSWQNTGTYGRILKKVITREYERFEKTLDPGKKSVLVHNIGYLIGIQRKLIRDMKKENSRN